MHLVRKDNLIVMAAPEGAIGGFAGWVLEMLRVGWLRAVVRREGGTRQMAVMETLPLGGRKQLMLVKCGETQFLVGTGAESVQTIVRVDGDKVEGSKARGFGEPV